MLTHKVNYSTRRPFVSRLSKAEKRGKLDRSDTPRLTATNHKMVSVRPDGEYSMT